MALALVPLASFGSFRFPLGAVRGPGGPLQISEKGRLSGHALYRNLSHIWSGIAGAPETAPVLEMDLINGPAKGQAPPRRPVIHTKALVRPLPEWIGLRQVAEYATISARTPAHLDSFPREPFASCPGWRQDLGKKVGPRSGLSQHRLQGLESPIFPSLIGWLGEHCGAIWRISGSAWELAGRQGFEPRYADPESAVLPLDDLPRETSILSNAARLYPPARTVVN